MGKSGPKPGTGGRPKKPLAEKIAEGNPGKRPLTVVDFKSRAAALDGKEMPKPSSYLSAKQKDGKKLRAREIYKFTWEWLAKRDCADLIDPLLLERYAISYARWRQCEEAVTEFGFLAKHPTTGNAMQSPYVAMSTNYQNQTQKLHDEIMRVVYENCTTELGKKTLKEDVMEQLLLTRKG